MEGMTQQRWARLPLFWPIDAACLHVLVCMCESSVRVCCPDASCLPHSSVQRIIGAVTTVPPFSRLWASCSLSHTAVCAPHQTLLCSFDPSTFH